VLESHSIHVPPNQPNLAGIIPWEMPGCYTPVLTKGPLGHGRS
jgi:hypothetical protein